MYLKLLLVNKSNVFIEKSEVCVWKKCSYHESIYQ